MNIETFLKLPIVDWYEESPIYSDYKGKFYNDLSEAECDLDEDQNLFDLRLMPTIPRYVRPLDSSYCEDIIPEGSELPDEILKAMDEFNRAVDGIVVSWRPINYRIRI